MHYSYLWTSFYQSLILKFPLFVEYDRLFIVSEDLFCERNCSLFFLHATTFVHSDPL